MGLFNENKRHLKKLNKIAEQVFALEESFKQKTDDELRAMTPVLKERFKNGESLADLLPEAFASVREAAARVLNMRHFPVQIVGGIALFQGRIAEMRTGEGKTLVSTLPAYLNAIKGLGVHVVTVNDYLAARDAEWMGKIHKFLGLTVGVSLANQTPEQKRAAYNCDITYATNNEIGFDYLRDNLAVRKEDRVMRGLDFAIIDEVDSILIDEARTPLIISGSGEKSSDLYVAADKFVKTLGKEDYDLDEKEKTIRLTDVGVAKAERHFKLENLGDIENLTLHSHINNALRANVIMHLDDNYIIKDGEILIVDENTGRLMIGRRYSNGLHQAIEAKEGVEIRNENQTLATITFQNLFRMYKKLSGMTGTAKTEEGEFNRIYSLDVVTIPPNLPSRRVDANDAVFSTEQGKYNNIINDVKETHTTGQPILIGTVTIEKSEYLSGLLKREKIPHVVLNAKNHQLEGEIVAQAGRLNAVTIATNMAGRGTDILLGGNPEYLAKKKLREQGLTEELINTCTAYARPNFTAEEVKAREEYKKLFEKFEAETRAEKSKVISLGGLKIIGTERHEARRIDNQLRGRAGRQGDPGQTIFYLSLEDDLIRRFAGEKLFKLAQILHIDPNMPMQFKILTHQIEGAQRRIEGLNFSARKSVLQFDDVMNKQREIIYTERNKVLDGENMHETVIKMFRPLVEATVYSVVDDNKLYNEWDYTKINNALEDEGIFPKNTDFANVEIFEGLEARDVAEMVHDEVQKRYAEKITDIDLNAFSEFERRVLLSVVDRKWIDHIDQMTILRNEIGLRGYGQKDPVIEYGSEGLQMFNSMVENINDDVAKILIGVKIERVEHTEEAIEAEGRPKKKLILGAGTPKEQRKTGPVKSDKTAGRNEPCPCGSGKKYKNCCGS